MALDSYRRLLRIPGVPTLLLVGLLARVPTTATGMALTLHVAVVMGLDFIPAGVITAASTIGNAIGSPLMGRMVDRYGLRPVLSVTTVAQAVFWSCAWSLPYWALVVTAVLAGLLALPVFSVTRQCLAALVPVEQRRTGFALDSMLVEVSYMVGPALAGAGIVTLGSGVTMIGIGAGLTVAGLVLILLNPPTRSAEELGEQGQRVPRRQWLTPSFVALLGTTAAATFVLTASELSLVATMEHAGETAWVGLAVAVWCVYSLVGGFVYGGLSRGFSPLLLIGAMGLLTIPVGLVDGGWQWVVLALLPAGLVCAPSLSSTVDVLSRWVPSAARGEAMGLHGTALMIGGAVSAPIAGAVIDSMGPSWAFAVAGLVAVIMVLAALPFWRSRPSAAPVPPQATPPSRVAASAVPDTAVPAPAAPAPAADAGESPVAAGAPGE
ncbi:MFS transporter [Nonomuraea aridisoli]|uniref:MFS transporter n=1 Tax=Nonomuraea aridisoli TaxID=2070368 RepID=A0A2W2DA90_9ACTN|nr:MFS transporter [Nonomuraea aridisoli]PZG08962.1 MFS transporter [Nonomuraea aridisoli]